VYLNREQVLAPLWGKLAHHLLEPTREPLGKFGHHTFDLSLRALVAWSWTSSCQHLWCQDLYLLSNLVARSHIHGTVQLEFDERFVPEFCLSEDVGASASQTIANPPNS